MKQYRVHWKYYTDPIGTDRVSALYANNKGEAILNTIKQNKEGGNISILYTEIRNLSSTEFKRAKW